MIKEIDGVFVNLDRVSGIKILTFNDTNRLLFLMETSNTIEGNVRYKTIEEAQERIREILKNQNLNKVKI